MDLSIYSYCNSTEIIVIFNDEYERSKREFEVEAVGYIVGRYFGLDMGGSAFYLAAWQDDDSDAIQDRLGRIRTTAATIIEVVEQRRE